VVDELEVVVGLLVDVDEDVVEDEVVLVVVVGGTTPTLQPVAMPNGIGAAFVSRRLRRESPMTAVALPDATVLKVTFATLTTLFGPSRRVFWIPETMLEPLVKVLELAAGAGENSVVFPPPTDAIVATAGVYVNVTEYPPSESVPASIRSSAMNCCPGCVVAGQERLASPVAA
jgi:hypothetical protein